MSDIKKHREREFTIIWQNQSHLVREYYKMLGIVPDLIDICRVTDMMVHYAQKGGQPDIVNAFEKMQAAIDASREEYSKKNKNNRMIELLEKRRILNMVKKKDTEGLFS